jgi:uncharacterized membrane protein
MLLIIFAVLIALLLFSLTHRLFWPVVLLVLIILGVHWFKEQATCIFDRCQQEWMISNGN